MSILITAATCPEAYRLQRLLGFDDVIFADRVDMPTVPETRQVILPSSDAPSFAHEMLRICLDHGVTEIYPLRLDEVIELAKTRQLFLEYGILLMIPSDQFIWNVSPINFGGADLCVIKDGIMVYPGDGESKGGPTEQNGLFRKETREGKSQYTLYIV